MEQALAAPADVVSLVCSGPYGTVFRAIYGTSVCDPSNVAAAYDNIGLAIAAFEASTASNAFTAKFDYVIEGPGPFYR